MIGLLLYTLHFSLQGLNAYTAGVYGVASNGATAAVYRNSDRRVSFAAGWTAPWGSCALTAGVVTGYGRPMPFLLPSCAARLTPHLYGRLIAFPKVGPMQSGGVTFSIEWRP